jgi:hypothetical protein
LPVASSDASGAAPAFSARLQALAEDVGVSIVALLDL